MGEQSGDDRGGAVRWRVWRRGRHTLPTRLATIGTLATVGDFLTVADPLPTPSPGHGYYYVTAVNFMGERRYGRRSTGGVLSERDPAVLPG